MSGYTRAVKILIEEISKIPSIGPRSAERIAFYILGLSKEAALKLTAAISNVKQETLYCKLCGNISEQEQCSICANAARDKTTLCIVEEPKDVEAIEATGKYRGSYHVLMGALSPLDGIGPQDIRMDDLILRLKKGAIKEAIIATDSDNAGEATALFLQKTIMPLGITVTRLAFGISVGSRLEYADPETLGRALEGRHEIK